MSRLLIHNSENYILVFQQKIASSSLSLLFKQHKRKNTLTYISPPDTNIFDEDEWGCSPHNQDLESVNTEIHRKATDDFRMILKGESNKKLIILTREPRKKHISGIVQDSVVNYIQKSIAELSELIEINCILSNVITWKTFLRTNKIQTKADLQKHFWDEVSNNSKIPNEGTIEVFRILLRGIFTLFFSDPNQTVYSDHRMPYNSILAIITRYVDKKNIVVFDIDEDEELSEWLVSQTGEDFYHELSHSNRKSRMNRMVETFLREEFPWKYKEILDIVKTESYGYSFLKNIRYE